MTPDLDISNSIKQLCVLFEKYPHILLTEDDMRFHLCSFLLTEFGKLQATEDGHTSISLHSEVRWYGKEGRLRFRSDVVIVDVSTLQVSNKGGLRLPSKGYGFDIPKAIIELKFRRPNGMSDRKFVDSIKGDCHKLRLIKDELGHLVSPFSCWVVVFDKKGDISGQIPNSHESQFVYRSSVAKRN